MHLFYAPDIDPNACKYTLSAEESAHCTRVLRLRSGDRFHITNGLGDLFLVEITEVDMRRAQVRVVECTREFEKRGYYLHIAAAPTKNVERFEWFVEKAVEIGVDRITPVLTQHSERKVLKHDRTMRVVTSAVKQSLKAYHPHLDELMPFKELVRQPFDGRKFIAHCEPAAKKVLLRDVVKPGESVKILIGPEGDFSPEEIAFAHANGFVDLTLGHSRLRAETAGVVAVHSINFINESDE